MPVFIMPIMTTTRYSDGTCERETWETKDDETRDEATEKGDKP